MLTWTSQHNQTNTFHIALVTETSETTIKKCVEACAEKAVQMLNENIQDNSLYLLCEWNPTEADLSICVTDSTKTLDSPHTIHCTFSGIAESLACADQAEQQNYAELIKFWLHDYLSSYAPFFNYSLVAIFHSSTREQTELL